MFKINNKDQNNFQKLLYGTILWIGFNSLKATEPLRGDSLLFTLSPREFPVLI